ncbi:MAG: glycosyltransferase family 2 protein [Candidatus Omnitrophota bacterium]|jgi:cellulose synthase (UDP-forming)
MRLQKKDLFISLAILAFILIFQYFLVRALLLLHARYSELELFFAVLLILAELFVLLHGFGYALNVIRVFGGKKNEPEERVSIKEEPAVAILVAARHEPREVLEETFVTLNNLNYKNKIIYFLDDSSEEKYKKEAEELSRDYSLRLFRREQRHGAKAGIINDCLKTLEQKYLVIFDADQNPLPEFMRSLIPMMEADKKMAFIQTPQFYSNIEENRIARAAAFQQAIFYEYICEGKSSNGSMFCCGTNVIFRTQALKESGGLDESSVTEDFATSLKLHSLGWKSLYFNRVYAFGMGPESLSSYFRQQYRWAAGTIAVFQRLLLRLFTRPFSLKFTLWWEYLLSSSYYLVGLAFFFLMFCPVIYLFFNIPSFFALPQIYLASFLPYIILTTGIFYLVLKGRNYRLKDLVTGQFLAAVTFSVYIRAALSVLFGVKAVFGITEKGKAKSLPYLRLWPQLSFMALNLPPLSGE